MRVDGNQADRRQRTFTCAYQRAACILTVGENVLGREDCLRGMAWMPAIQGGLALAPALSTKIQNVLTIGRNPHAGYPVATGCGIALDRFAGPVLYPQLVR